MITYNSVRMNYLFRHRKSKCWKISYREELGFLNVRYLITVNVILVTKSYGIEINYCNFYLKLCVLIR